MLAKTPFPHEETRPWNVLSDLPKITQGDPIIYIQRWFMLPQKKKKPTKKEPNKKRQTTNNKAKNVRQNILQVLGLKSALTYKTRVNQKVFKVEEQG